MASQSILAGRPGGLHGRGTLLTSWQIKSTSTEGSRGRCDLRCTSLVTYGQWSTVPPVFSIIAGSSASWGTNVQTPHSNSNTYRRPISHLPLQACLRKSRPVYQRYHEALAPANRDKQKVGTPSKAPLSPCENILWQSVSKSRKPKSHYANAWLLMEKKHSQTLQQNWVLCKGVINYTITTARAVWKLLQTIKN